MDNPLDLVKLSYAEGKRLLENKQPKTLKENGQFLTPVPVALYMSKQLGRILNGAYLLDPAIGSGVLACAVIERLISEAVPVEIFIEGYEIDHELCIEANRILSLAAQKASQHGIKINWKLYEEDFILTALSYLQPSLFQFQKDRRSSFNYIISNPPYFKLNSNDTKVKAASASRIKGHTNIYTLFMAISAKMLAKQGRACFIVPRSFCSGSYFSEFRQDFLSEVTPLSVHLFQSRGDIFEADDVLQENIIITYEKPLQAKSRKYWANRVEISTSQNDRELETKRVSRQVSTRHFLNPHNKLYQFRLPTGILDEQILDLIDQWEGSLERYGMQVSTGPVVSFRARHLVKAGTLLENGSVPLLWMQNVKPYLVEWPLYNIDKPQLILTGQQSLLVSNANYVLLRRFSAKEDRRRIISGPWIADRLSCCLIGLENHLNFIYRKHGNLHSTEAFGLAALINSAFIDRYFRIVNGNTQINATELRALPLPPLEIIRHIGESIQDIQLPTSEVVDKIVYSILREMGLLPEDFPMIQETRIMMGKIEQAQEILESLGLPTEQRNEMAALTLLVLAQLSEDTPWENGVSRSLRVHDILVGIKERYGRDYAENTRETIRRHVLHQFEQAGLVLRNPEDPALATNSPKTHYVLTDDLLSALRSYGTPQWEESRKAFLSQKGALLEIYQKTREQNAVPLRVADGKVFHLSPGKHNSLQAAIVEEFGPRFAPGAKLLYLGDAARKTLIFERELFTELGVIITDHGKLPDVVLYDEKSNRIFLIEAVTSHGPVSPKRQFELEELFKTCHAVRIYVTAFIDLATFKRFLGEIAWETEVWIAEILSHMIHFNGDRFLGSR